MADYLLVIDETTKQPKCLKPISALQSITDLGSNVNASNPNAPVVTVTSSDGADTSFTIPIPPGSTPSITNLGSSVDTTNPSAPVVTVTSSDGTDTSFTIPIPPGSAPSITNLGNTIVGTNVTITSSDGQDTTIPMAQVINAFFASLPNCT